MKFKFSKNLEYQLNAINAIDEVFEGGVVANELGIGADFKLAVRKDLSDLRN